MIEGVGDVGFGMFGDYLRDAFDEGALRIGGDTACQIKGMLVPIAGLGSRVAGVFHALVVSWAPGECNNGVCFGE
ncbi:hypothetical protein D9M70_489300 [compost metagenome]